MAIKKYINIYDLKTLQSLSEKEILSICQGLGLVSVASIITDGIILFALLSLIYQIQPFFKVVFRIRKK